MKSGYTPKEAAFDTAIGWLREAYNNRTKDTAIYTQTPSEERRYRIQVAKLHNRLLAQSGMDGTILPEEG